MFYSWRLKEGKLKWYLFLGYKSDKLNYIKKKD